MRSHYCGDINSSNIGSNIEISGWVHKRRDHGGVIFLDIRDLHGIVQVVFNPDLKEIFDIANKLNIKSSLKPNLKAINTSIIKGPNRYILITGSLYLIGKIRKNYL